MTYYILAAYCIVAAYFWWRWNGGKPSRQFLGLAALWPITWLLYRFSYAFREALILRVWNRNGEIDQLNEEWDKLKASGVAKEENLGGGVSVVTFPGKEEKRP